jgi:hypothetical protein
MFGKSFGSILNQEYKNIEFILVGDISSWNLKTLLEKSSYTKPITKCFFTIKIKGL